MTLAAWPRTGYLPVVSSIPEPEPEPEPATEPAPPAWIDHPAIDRTINQMLGVGGRLIIAHGGYIGGNHHIASVDLTTGQPITGPLAPSEGFDVVREIDGVIYLPWNDPTGAWNAPQGYTYSDDGGATWRHRHAFPAYHVYDIRKHDGSLFISGSGPASDGAQRAKVWRSDDNGATWQESLAVPGASLPRFYNLAPADGALWTSTVTIGPSATYRHTPGTGWEEITPAPFLTHAASLNLAAGGVLYCPTFAFDGSRSVAYDGRRPSWADASHVYGINRDTGTIDRAPLLTPEDTEVTWSPWLDMSEGMTGHVATCATRHDGFVYVGGTHGRIWRFSAP